MIAFQYLQHLAAIRYTRVADLIASGQLSFAISRCHQAIRKNEIVPDNEFHLIELHHCCADLSLLIGNPEEAEDWYRKAAKLCNPDTHSHYYTLRAAGLQALFRNRLENATACFHKITHTAMPAGLQSLHYEAALMLSAIFYETGPRPLARQTLQAMAESARQGQQAEWLALSQLFARETELLAALHTSEHLKDDMCWKAYDDDGLICIKTPRNELTAELPVARLIQARRKHLDLLESLTQGGRVDTAQLQAIFNSMGSHLSRQYREVLVLEMAMASIPAQKANILEILLANLQLPHLGSSGLPTGLVTSVQKQILYCFSKLRFMQGHVEDGMLLYQQYSMYSMVFMRDNFRIVNRYISEVNTEHGVVHDEISIRLPARYRRAYQYMAAKLHLKDLSITEVAEFIGVSERALQIAFKEYANITPREALRRLRMEKIREELVRSEENHAGNLMDVAMKYGIQNRTSLATGYRKYYNEVPSATVAKKA
jgi:AraC-like DNA-binding protein